MQFSEGLTLIGKTPKSATVLVKPTHELRVEDDSFSPLNCQQRFRIALATRLVGHFQYHLNYYHLMNAKDNPNLVDKMMYGRKIIGRESLDAYSVRKKWMFGRTPVINWISVLQVGFNETSQTLTNVAAGSTSVGTGSGFGNILGVTCASASSAYGVVVGSNSTAVARTDTKLNTQITHGTSASTLNHGAGSVGAVTNPSGSITRVVLQRVFTGNAGSTVSMQEDALYLSSLTNKYCAERNVNAFGSIAAAQVVTVTKNWDATA